MASSSRDSIRQSIELVGAEQILAQLKALGTVGAQAGADISRGMQAVGPGLQSLSANLGNAAPAFQTLSRRGQELLLNLRDDLPAGGKKTRDELGKVSDVSKAAQFGLRDLGFQINDIATSLATGSPPARVFAQQIGQVVGAFEQGGGFSAVMGAAAKALKSFVTPLNLAIAGGAGIAGGIALLVKRAGSVEDATRQFQVLLDTAHKNPVQVFRGGTDTAPPSGSRVVSPIGPESVNSGSVINAAQLVKAAKDLRTAGLSFADARDKLVAVLREPTINPAIAERLVRIGQNLDAVYGKGTFERFIKAVAGGQATLRQFGEEVGAISKASPLQSLAGEITTIEKQFKDAREKSMSPTQKAIENLGIAWSGFLDTLAKSAPILDVLKALQFLVPWLTRLLSSHDGIPAIGAALIGIIPAVFAVRAAFRGLALATSATPIGAIASAIAILAAVLVANWPTIKPILDELAAWIVSLPERLQATGQQIGGIFGGIVQVVGDNLKVIKDLFTGNFSQAFADWKQMWLDFFNLIFVTLLDAAVQFAKNTFTDFFTWAIAKAGEVARDIASIIGGAFGNAPPPPTPSFAGGGYISGAGTGTSDSIMARVSNGEFVVNALSTARFLPLLQAINSLRGFSLGGLVGRITDLAMPRFATGGPVLAGGGASGRPVILQFPDRSFNLRGDADAVQSLTRYARGKAVTSGGAKPSWYRG